MLIEYVDFFIIIIIEINIFNRENLMYFGNVNEVYVIYNFLFLLLFVNILVMGDCMYLKSWMMSMLLV